jgi:hypothetical protein
VNVRSGETRKATASYFWRILRLTLEGAAALLVFSTGFSQVGGGANLQSIAVRFPDPGRVMADYSDDPSRYTALTALLNALPHGQATYAKSFAYSQAINQLVYKYTMRGSDPQARKAFDDRTSQLMRDQNFRRSVLEKYNVANLPVERQPTTGKRTTPAFPPGRAAPVMDTDQLLTAAAPFWIATLVVMAFLPRLVMTLTGRLASSGPPEVDASNNPLQLPESLRNFKVLGACYALEMQSGQVIEEKTWSETHNSVVNSAPVIQFVGNQAYQTGGGMSFVSTTVTKDRVWLRTLNGGETVWNFTGGGFVTRQGQIVSAITRPRADGNSDFLIAFNHTTGQSQSFNSALSSKRVGILFPWIVTTLLGTAGFLLEVAVMFQLRLGHAGSFLVAAPFALLAATYTDWGTCLICAALAARIFSSSARNRVQRQRVKRYEKQFKPALMRHLQQATPTLAQYSARA